MTSCADGRALKNASSSAAMSVAMLPVLVIGVRPLVIDAGRVAATAADAGSRKLVSVNDVRPATIVSRGASSVPSLTLWINSAETRSSRHPSTASASRLRQMFLTECHGCCRVDDLGAACEDAGILDALNTPRSMREAIPEALRPIAVCDSGTTPQLPTAVDFVWCENFFSGKDSVG